MIGICPVCKKIVDDKVMNILFNSWPYCSFDCKEKAKEKEDAERNRASNTTR